MHYNGQDRSSCEERNRHCPGRTEGFQEGSESVAVRVVELVKQQYGIGGQTRALVSDSEVRAVEKELGVVLPRSYRAFLRHFGSSPLCGGCYFGLPRHRLWGDLVLMNELAAPHRPAHYVLFRKDTDGRVYFLDTSRRDDQGECPVVVRCPARGESVLADSFVEFLQTESRV